MKTFKIRHFNLNRILLLLIGLWPYQRSKLTRLQSSLFFGIIMTFAIFQSATFWTSCYTMDRFLKTFSGIIVTVIVIFQYLSFSINTKTVKYLLDQIQCSYDELKDKNELAIIENYWIKTKNYTTIFTILGTCGVFGIILLQFWPRILDIVLPINKTRPLQQIQIFSDYIFDGERYIYLMLLHSNASICIGAYAMIGTGTFMLAYYFHVCGMFQIASHRIQRAMQMNMLQSTSSRKEYLIHKDIVCAIDIHRKALQYCEYCMSKFALWFTLLIVTGILSISLHLLLIFQAISSGFKILDIVAYITTALVQYVYMFMGNYVAQEVADYYNYLFVTVYNAQWYIASLHIQRIMLFLLQRGTKPFNLNLGGLFVGSLEGFTVLMNASISYFTIIYSTQQ